MLVVEQSVGRRRGGWIEQQWEVARLAQPRASEALLVLDVLRRGAQSVAIEVKSHARKAAPGGMEAFGK